MIQAPVSHPENDTCPVSPPNSRSVCSLCLLLDILRVIAFASTPTVVMAVSLLPASFNISIQDSRASTATRTFAVTARLPPPSFVGNAKSSLHGCPLLIRTSSRQVHRVQRARSLSVRCEQSTEGGGLDVWLGRVAMIGFAVALSVEVATGKGLLENFGVTSPLPTVALAVTALVGVLTAVFIFQSASKN